MNKLKTNFSLTSNKQQQAQQQNVKLITSSSSSTSSTSSSSSCGILKMNSMHVNQSSMANSFDSQCQIAKNASQQQQLQLQQQMKKKRTALENISNATHSTNSSNATNSNTINVSKEVTKKSRFGSGISTSSSSTGNGVQPQCASSALNIAPVKKHNEVTIKKSNSSKDAFSSSKENINSVILPNLMNKKLNEQKAVQKTTTLSTTANGNKQQLQIKQQSLKVESTSATNETSKQSNATSIVKQTMSADSNMVLIKTEKTESVEVKQEKITKFESGQSTSSNELHIERQLATTTISSSSSSLSMSTISTVSCPAVIIDQCEQVVELSAETVEGWEDIDLDESDEFNASEYVSYIFRYYREREKKFAVQDYLVKQPHINKQMRHLLVDWMVEVQQQLEFNHEVLYLSVKLLDLYLNSRRIEKEKLQLLGGAAMFIACKFEERMPPIIEDFIYVSDNAYDRKELIKMECDILKTISFDIGVPLSYTFLRRYSKCLKADMKFLTLARYILELSLQDYSFSYVSDSLKACAALYLALKMAVSYERNFKLAAEANNNINNNSNNESNNEQQQTANLTVSTSNLTSTEWNPTLIHYTGSFLKDFIAYVPTMNNLIKTAAMSKYKTIFKKYSHQVFYEVAKISPLNDAEINTLLQNSNTDVLNLKKKINQ